MLALEKQTGQFQNFNLRPEKHGDENVPGADLKISFTDGNGVLSEFHPVLRSFLYKQEESPDQAEMPVGDARDARQLLPKLQSLLDRMANDPHTGTMFEADGDTLRDAIHLCRAIVMNAAQRKGDA